MVNIRQMLVDSSKYYIKCPYPMNPIGITIHNTSNDASANNEISYMRNNNYETSFHYAVDDIEIVQGLPLDRNGWHASDGGEGVGNRSTIAIEICYSKSGGSRFDRAEENAVDLVVYLLKKYGWGIDKVKRHYDYARDKKYCPHRTMDKGWQRFLNMIQAELDYKPQYKSRSGYLNVKPFMNVWSVFKTDKYWETWNRLTLLNCKEGLSFKILENPRYAVYKVESFEGVGWCYAEDNGNTTVTASPAYKVSEEPEAETLYDVYVNGVRKLHKCLGKWIPKEVEKYLKDESNKVEIIKVK